MKASVIVITYNQERFIGQAIDSVLMQRVSDPFEVVIGDDCSTDGTAEIVRHYAERHPGIIRPLWVDRNLGMMPNFRRCWEACRGQYIAVLEGDDYWISPDKLQRQIDAMDRHPEWSMCFERVRMVFDDGRPPSELPAGPQPPVFTVRELLVSNPIQPAGVVYRRGVLGEWPEGLDELALGDWPLGILHALRGDVGFLDEVAAVYRWHGAGSWSPRPQEWKVRQCARMFDVIRPLIERGLRDPELMWTHDARWVVWCMEIGWRARARRHARLCVTRSPFRPYSWRLLLWSHLGPFGRRLDPQSTRRREAAPRG